MLVNSILSLVVLTLLVFLSIQIIKQLRLISLKKNAVDQPDLYKKISIYELKLFKKTIFLSLSHQLLDHYCVSLLYLYVI
ncbi:hypothetical protein [Enterococcus sp. DIV2381]|uniref:hypothetical protein n=1 Tax=unclassified Enterococcus TaxID=2608891 RepID=UPI001AC7DA2B|nr:hypothetical protein [Enterococcus sp. DIV1271a]